MGRDGRIFFSFELGKVIWKRSTFFPNLLGEFSNRTIEARVFFFFFLQNIDSRTRPGYTLKLILKW